MTAQQLIDTLFGYYRMQGMEFADTETISIGHWKRYVPDCQLPKTIHELPTFSADISVTIGELRAMATPKPAPIFERAAIIKKLSED